MYQILIVDDEATEREVIRFLLNKYHFPLQITETSNGKEALELLSRKKFDILFTDIKMPFIDGLTLAGKVRNLYPDMHIVFFSGHDDFKYVKEALSLRVVNYILKPVDPEEFQKTISDVLERIHTQEELFQKEQTAQDFAQAHILSQLINQVSMEQLQKLYPQLDLSFAYAFHRLFLIQLERDFFGSETDGPNPDAFSPDLRRILPKDSCFFNLNPAQNLLLFSGQKHRMEWYLDLAEKITAYMQKACHIHCYIAISNSFERPEDISHAYEEAERHLTERFFFTNCSLFGNGTPVDFSPDPNPPKDDDILKQLQADIRFKDAFGLKQHMDILLGRYRQKKNYSHIYIRFLCTNVLKLLLDGLSDAEEDSFDKYASAIYRFHHFSEIESILLGLTERLADTLKKDQQSPKHAIQLVKQYIHNHYGEDLSLDILSKEVYLSPRYLSSIFIEETGCGINRYIKKVRMEKAQELLLDTNQKVSEICRKVGYSNLSYFCKSFTETFGATPEKFRQKKSFTNERS